MPADCLVNGVATLSCIFPVLANVIRWAVIFAGTVSVIVIVIAGIKLIYSGGDAKQVEGARKAIGYSLLGLILVLCSFAIINIIAGVTSVKCLSATQILSFTSCQ
jgi:hypothetical protein